jgi:hypothetical protein
MGIVYWLTAVADTLPDKLILCSNVSISEANKLNEIDRVVQRN